MEYFYYILFLKKQSTAPHLWTPTLQLLISADSIIQYYSSILQMQRITPREVPYLELVIVLALLALTLKYRSDLEEALTLNASHELRLAQLAKFVTTIQGQQKELEDYYHNNY